MRVFVTGATGFVGSAIVQELISAGHQVLGLARSDAGAESLIAAGAAVHRGDLDDIGSLLGGVADSDAVIHTAFNHDFSNYKANAAVDKQVIIAIGEVLKGTEKPFIVTSGLGLLKPGENLALETDRPVPGTNPRASEEAADLVAAMGVNVVVMRLPPSVHGKGDHGFVPILIKIAREKGFSAYKEEGTNRWPAVHRVDAARLYRLAIEKVLAPGTRVHAVAEEGIDFRDLATAIGEGLNLPVVSKTLEEATEHFGWFAYFAAMDCASSSDQTKAVLEWEPVQAGLLEDLQAGGYFSI